MQRGNLSTWTLVEWVWEGISEQNDSPLWITECSSGSGLNDPGLLSENVPKIFDSFVIAAGKFKWDLIKAYCKYSVLILTQS